ncbi:T9SS type A sorting domain-containing protein [Hyunsoonleella sp. SJ7]|uniref:T9SS type A sorting domain-containing protein n=1 Tax=Hyunsoonleella aquatilis TaxID=2762758 RepID=A0A923H7G0_9FLAO|nr:T9SS type A sorting domain-containing protein [Hyunsoonleella aquatilis]MBC3757008.1 T9SS type A sorting domain-containing protein [Hyunsoonleella aquatilis]
MKKNYFFYVLLLVLSLITFDGFSQDIASNDLKNSLSIEGLSVFPNPVNMGKSTIYIDTKQNALKSVAVFNVLGKQILAPVITRKELDISTLSSGVYILKITENAVTETRKLVIR